jgi:hypothetical protein
MYVMAVVFYGAGSFLIAATLNFWQRLLRSEVFPPISDVSSTDTLFK